MDYTQVSPEYSFVLLEQAGLTLHRQNKITGTKRSYILPCFRHMDYLLQAPYCDEQNPYAPLVIH